MQHCLPIILRDIFSGDQIYRKHHWENMNTYGFHRNGPTVRRRKLSIHGNTLELLELLHAPNEITFADFLRSHNPDEDGLRTLNITI